MSCTYLPTSLVRALKSPILVRRDSLNVISWHGRWLNLLFRASSLGVDRSGYACNRYKVPLVFSIYLGIRKVTYLYLIVDAVKPRYRRGYCIGADLRDPFSIATARVLRKVVKVKEDSYPRGDLFSTQQHATALIHTTRTKSSPANPVGLQPCVKLTLRLGEFFTQLFLPEISRRSRYGPKSTVI